MCGTVKFFVKKSIHHKPGQKFKFPNLDTLTNNNIYKSFMFF